MKKTLSATFLLLITLVLSSSIVKKTPDISRNVIKALQENDLNLILQCYPKPQDFDTIASSIKNAEERESFIALYKSRFADKSSAAIENFKQIRAEGISKGIDWSKVEKSDVQYDRMIRKGKIRFCDIFIQVSSGDRDYWIKLDDCIYSGEKGWLILDNITLKDNYN